MEDVRGVIDLILKAIAVAMAFTSVVLGVLGETSPENQIFFLGIGLAALAISVLPRGSRGESK